MPRELIIDPFGLLEPDFAAITDDVGLPPLVVSVDALLSHSVASIAQGELTRLCSGPLSEHFHAE